MSVPETANAPQPSRRQALIEKLRTRLIGSRGAEGEPIAVIGMGCRFPGSADSPEAYWELLRDGVDTITEVPPDRWNINDFYDRSPDAPGKMISRWGGFLGAIDWFDAAFFGIAPREASRMDPQQRLLLEVTWEALENAGILPKSLAKSPTGVFIGASFSDYGFLQMSDPHHIDAYTGTGTALCIIANRLSYLLDLRGPSMTIDTACSSSLVAVHHACQALRSRECSLTIAGGVNIILSPALTVGMSKLAALSPDGRCKTFDARANGYVRGEGCGVVVLKRLSDALAAGDPIAALIRGSAVHSEGHSNGLTAPNGSAQQALLRAALTNAGVDASQVSYIETHGTGTALGDPIEVEALAPVYGPPRDDGVGCLLGSVKTNVGHLEPAAGIAGLIKVILCLRHRTVPPTLHFQSLNPHITLEGTRLAIASAYQLWPPKDVPFLAAVSSFGIGGTIAHVVLEETPRGDGASTGVISIRGSRRAKACVLPLSARHPDALRALAETFRDSFSRGYLAAEDLSDVCATAAVRRDHHEYRLAVVAYSPSTMAEHLNAFLAGEKRLGIVSGHCRTDSPRRVVFVFSGQGAQWIGMGRQLLREEMVFREAIHACDEAVVHRAGWSVLEELQADEKQSRLNEVDVIQPCIFAVQVAIAAQWRAFGIEPAAVIGHSMGEIAAAHVAGALDIDDAVRIVCGRSRIARQHASGKGGMAVVELSMEDALRAISGYDDRLSVAASNGPTSSVLSGDTDALDAVLRTLQSKNIFCRPIKVDYASHSPHMDPLRPMLMAEFGPVFPQPLKIPFYSTVTRTRISGPELDAGYWVRNLREPVQFWPTLRLLTEEGMNIFVDLSPHPILTTAVEDALRHLGVPHGGCAASLRRDQDERISLLASLGHLFTLGHPVDFRFLYPEGKHRVVRLPNYPWQRQRYWLPKLQPTLAVHSAPGAHPFLQHRLSSPVLKDRVYETILTPDTPSLLSHCRLGERTMVPAAAWIDAALTAASRFHPGPLLLESFSVIRPITLHGTASARAQCIVQQMDDCLYFQVVSQALAARDSDQWTVRAKAQLRPYAPAAADRVDRAAIVRRCAEQLEADAFFSALASNGIILGSVFQCFSSIHLGPQEALVRLEPPATASATFQFHPAALELCFYLLALVASKPDDAHPHLMPVAVNALEVRHVPATPLWCHVRCLDAQALEGSIAFFDDAGRIVARAASVRLGPIPRDLRPKVEPRKVPREVFSSLPPEKQPMWLEGFVADRIAAVIGIPRASLDLERSLREHGTDSLLALEMIRHIERDLGVRMPVEKILGGACTLDLVKLVVESMSKATPPTRSIAPRAGASKKAGVVLFAPNRSARVRLFCFPYSAGGASAFRSWHRYLPDHVEIRAIRPPGREERIDEPAHTSIDALLDEVMADLKPQLDRPFAFYGHSLGGTIAFELARRLRAEGLPLPSHLFIGAALAPHLPRKESFAQLSDDALSDYLALLQGTAAAVLQDPDARRITLRILRADLSVLDSYQCSVEPPLPCPITVFAGRDDPLADRAALDAWRQHTTATVIVRTLPGGHFFLHSHLDELLESMGSSLNFSSSTSSGATQYSPAERNRDSVPARDA